MPRGAPDYSNVRPEGPMIRAEKLYELAARLGSPVTHDRAGLIVFIDTFDNGIASWLKSEGATGGSVALTTETSRSGSFCAKVVTGSGENEASQLFRLFPYPDVRGYGLEFSVAFGSDVKYLIWTLAQRDGTHEHQFQSMYMREEKEIVVTIPGGSSIRVYDDIDLHVSRSLFHTIKLVADFKTGKYIRLIVNEKVIPLPDYEPYTFPLDISPHLATTFTVYGDTGENDYLYIDDVIVTRDEE